MLEGSKAFSGIAVKDIDRSRHFFGEVLGLQVDDVAAVVAWLTGRGVAFEHYEGTPVETDDDGVFRGGGPLIAWFTDPSGNVMSVIEGPGLDG